MPSEDAVASTTGEISSLVDVPTADRLTAGAAALIALTLPIRAVFPYASSVISVGLILAVMVLPVIATRAKSYRYTGIILALFSAALISCPLLMADTSRQFDNRIAIIQILNLVFAAVSLLTLLWLRYEIGLRRMAILYSIGLFIQKVLTLNSLEAGELNPWKYALLVPVAIFLLAISAKPNKRWPTVGALVLIGALAASSGYRSFFAVAMITLFAFLWIRRPNAAGAKLGLDQHKTLLTRIGTIFILVVTAFIVYQVSIQLALSGYLGERNATITRMQAGRGESILAAGRTENAAAWQLFIRRPIGYGPGAVPSAEDIAAGNAGLVSRGVRLDSSVISDYVFGQGMIKLHSVISDFWVQFGLFGLLLGLFFLFLACTILVRNLSNRKVAALELFLACICIWDLFFSPILSSLGEVIFAIAVILPLQGSRKADGFDRQHSVEPNPISIRGPSTAK